MYIDLGCCICETIKSIFLAITQIIIINQYGRLLHGRYVIFCALHDLKFKCRLKVNLYITLNWNTMMNECLLFSSSTFDNFLCNHKDTGSVNTKWYYNFQLVFRTKKLQHEMLGNFLPDLTYWSFIIVKFKNIIDFI